MKRRQLSEIWFRLRKGRWCDHFVTEVVMEGLPGGGWTWVQAKTHSWRNLQGRTDGSGWEMIDCGMRQMRQCSLCGYTEFRPK